VVEVCSTWTGHCPFHYLLLLLLLLGEVYYRHARNELYATVATVSQLPRLDTGHLLNRFINRVQKGTASRLHKQVEFVCADVIREVRGLRH
jgi:hypothetical protein